MPDESCSQSQWHDLLAAESVGRARYYYSIAFKYLKNEAAAVSDGVVFRIVAESETRLVKGDGSQAVARQRT